MKYFKPHFEKYYKYRVKIPNEKGKMVIREIIFTTKDLERLFDYYKIPYKKVEEK